MKYRNRNNFGHKNGAKIGVLLVNLGTPQAPTAKAVRPYLKQFLSDPRVVEIPRAIWYFILNGIILPFRSKKSAQAYASIWTEQGSPLLCNTQALAQSVATQFDEKQVLVEFAMRYGSPSMDDKISALLDQGVEKLLVLPLYPQYSATTTASTFDAVAASFKTRRWFPELRFVNQYLDEPKYIQALADKVKAHWQQHGKADRLMLSYHGIPKHFWDNGDPYVCQCFKTSRLLAEALQVEPDSILTCFQSRFGKAQWVEPYTDATLKSLPSQGVKSIQVMCPGFSVDCLETLEEIAEENREYFMEAGGESYQYIDCLNQDEAHVDAITEVIKQNLQGWQVASDRGETEQRYLQKKSV